VKTKNEKGKTGFLVLCCSFFLFPFDVASAQPGITAAPQVARAYDLILDANFDELDLPPQ
jgi:hypothetical protein